MSNKKYSVILNGEVVNDMSSKDIVDLVQNGKLQVSDKIWSEGFDGWKKISDSDMFDKFKSEQSPPPVPIDEIDNTYIWMLTFMPLSILIVEYIFGLYATVYGQYIAIFISLIANTICVWFDAKTIEKSGRNNPSIWLVLLIPAYLWKRAKCLGEKQKYVAIWLVILFSSLLINDGGLLH